MKVGGHRTVCFTADVEQDCPPYLSTVRGMSDGLPHLLDLLAEFGVTGTFFTTGEMARRFPGVIERLVAEGHELGCHGDTHADFTTLDRAAARGELRRSLETLRAFAPVVSFRAPYLRFPSAYLPLLADEGLSIDSSIARYKFGANHSARPAVAGLVRIPASVTSSVLRLPAFARNLWLRTLQDPAVLFVHPWEAADFRSAPLRYDCRFRTGEQAITAWRGVLAWWKARGTRFGRICDFGVA